MYYFYNLYICIYESEYFLVIISLAYSKYSSNESFFLNTQLVAAL